MVLPNWFDQLTSLLTLLVIFAGAVQVIVQKLKPLYVGKFPKAQAYIDECLSALVGIGLVSLFQVNIFAPFSNLIPASVPSFAGWIIGGLFVGIGSNFLQAFLQVLSYIHDLPQTPPVPQE